MLTDLKYACKYTNVNTDTDTLANTDTDTYILSAFSIMQSHSETQVNVLPINNNKQGPAKRLPRLH